MAIDEAESSDSGGTEGSPERASEPGEAPVVAGRYSWLDFYAEHGDDGDLEALQEAMRTDGERSVPTREDFDRAGLDPEETLGFDPTGIEGVLSAASGNAAHISEYLSAMQQGETPVVKGWYSWEDYKHEYFYDEEGNPPTDSEGNPKEFDPTSELGFDPRVTENVVDGAGNIAGQLADVVDRRTVNVNEELDEDDFFTTDDGVTTIANRYDLEKEVPLTKKGHFQEVERYWVNKPYAFVIIFHSTKENEKKYYLIQPNLNVIEEDLQEYLTGKLRASIKYSEEGSAAADEENRRKVIEDETLSLLDRYDLYELAGDEGRDTLDAVAKRLGVGTGDSGMTARVLRALGWEGHRVSTGELEGIAARPEPVVVEEDPESLNDYQVEKLLYYLKRDFIGYERIDGIKHDINVEDISCDGYNSPVFVYHSDYEQIISNIYHGEDELDDFVVKLAQRSGKGISKRSPQVDATLPDGSRAQLTLGREVSDHGTNYTIRQFKDVPFTPIDLINWKTFSLEEMAFLWLCIENNKSLIFAGGTASGKTTSLNAVSLFIPSNSKIVSIEDTREVELPQRNWVASVTRPSFTEDEKGDIDEFDLLEAALRQRPDYIVMGEIRGEEGRTLFQVMSTGHTTYTTFHADSVGEVLKRFTTEPINVSKTMFTALDLVSIQTQTRVSGHKVRRNKNLTEINHYDAENDEINVQDVYQWQAETDQYLKMGESNTLEEIKFDRGWNQRKLDDEVFKRQAVLAYLIDRGLKTYTQVAATFQAFINDPETILTLMANDGLETSLEDLREMESVLIDVDPEKEEMVPRPDPGEEQKEEAQEILEEAEERLFDEYRGEAAAGVASALMMDSQPDVTADAGASELEEITSDPDQQAGPAEASASSPESTPGPTQTPTGAESVPGGANQNEAEDEQETAPFGAGGGNTQGDETTADAGEADSPADSGVAGSAGAGTDDFETYQSGFDNGATSEPPEEFAGGENPYSAAFEGDEFTIETSDEPVTIGRIEESTDEPESEPPADEAAAESPAQEPSEHVDDPGDVVGEAEALDDVDDLPNETDTAGVEDGVTGVTDGNADGEGTNSIDADAGDEADPAVNDDETTANAGDVDVIDDAGGGAAEGDEIDDAGEPDVEESDGDGEPDVEETGVDESDGVEETGVDEPDADDWAFGEVEDDE